MKVICDNCGAMYKIPDEKLAKPVNKATCRQCGHRMLIPRPRRGADPDERTLVTAVPPTPPPAASRSAVPAAPSLPMSLVEHEEKTAPTGGRGVDETRWVRNDVPARPQPAVAGVAVSTSDPGERGPAMTERVPAHAAAPLKPQPARQTPPLRSLPAEPQFGDDEVDLDDEVATAVEPDPTPAAKAASKSAGKAPVPAKSTPAPPAKANPPAKAAVRAPIDAAPAASEARAYDPRGDLGLALFGVFAAGLGVVLLAIASVIDARGSLYAVDLTLSALGTALAIGGTLGAGLVLLSGGRGRKPAWRAVSVTLGVLAGLGLGGLPAAARVAYDMFGHFQSDMTDLMASVTPEAPVTPDPLVEPLAVAAPDPAGIEAPPPVDLGLPPEAGALADGTPASDPVTTTAPPSSAGTPSGTPAATVTSSTPAGSTRSTGTGGSTTSAPSNRSGTSTGRSSGTSTGRTSPTDDLLSGPAPTRTLGATTPSGGSKPPPRDLSDDEERDLEDDIGLGKTTTTTPAVASNLPATPPLAAVDVMIKSNVGIKKCFFEHQRAEGALPPKIEVKFTIKPTGDTTGYEIKQPKYQGSELESCLIRNMRSITFPPSQQGTTLTFPFVFG